MYAEWHNKAVGFVSYGAVGGVRAAEHLRQIAGELRLADVRQQVSLTLATDFEHYSVFKPGGHQLPQLNSLFDEVVAWSTVLASLRPGRHDGRLTTTLTGPCPDTQARCPRRCSGARAG